MFGQFRSDFLPYCLHQLGKDAYVVLNREYKPVGLITDATVEYQDYAVQIKGLTPLRASKLSVHGNSDRSWIYLYNDGYKPESKPEHAKAYFKRLGILLKLKTTPIGPALTTPWQASVTPEKPNPRSQNHQNYREPISREQLDHPL